MLITRSSPGINQRLSPSAVWPLERKVLGYDPWPQILKEPKSLYQSPRAPLGVSQSKAEVDSDRSGRLLGRASVQLGVGARLPEGWPNLRSWASAAKNHAAQLIAESFCLFGV